MQNPLYRWAWVADILLGAQWGSHLADPFPVCFTADVRTQLQRQMVLLLPGK